VSFEQEPGWLEPGVEQHAWESEYEAILPLIEDDPAEALPELASLVERMLVDRGYLTRPRGLDRSEQAVSVAAAREVSERWRAGEDVDPGDIGFAIGELRAMYGSLLADASTA
jgi:hypothetical protein